MENSYCVLLYSKFSPVSLKILDLIKNSGFNLNKLINLQVVCVDNEIIRKRINKSKEIIIDKVPSVLVVHDDGNVEKYDNNKVFEWLNEIFKKIEKKNAPPQQQPTPTLPSPSPTLPLQPQHTPLYQQLPQQPIQPSQQYQQPIQQPQQHQQPIQPSPQYQQPIQTPQQHQQPIQHPRQPRQPLHQQPLHQQPRQQQIPPRQINPSEVQGRNKDRRSTSMVEEVVDTEEEYIDEEEIKPKNNKKKITPINEIDTEEDEEEEEEKPKPKTKTKTKAKKKISKKVEKIDNRHNEDGEDDVDKEDRSVFKRIPAAMRTDKNNYEFNAFGTDENFDINDNRHDSGQKRAIRDENTKNGVKKNDIISAALEIQKEREKASV